jgi:phosphoribosylamine--glycine ligase
MSMPQKMKVMVVGGGGREHALCWKIAQSSFVTKVYCAPGNGGTATESKSENVDIQVDDFDALSKFARENQVDLLVIGPDDPLANGIVDHLSADGLRVFGPDKQAAKLESSKAFAKEFMSAQRLPTARYIVADSQESAQDIVTDHPWARVIKVDGLALGKGVFVCDSEQEAQAALTAIFKERRFGDAGNKVIIEEKLTGEEMSLMVFCDGERLLPMPAARDHKRRFDGDKGPNTGGMGAYAPADLYQRARRDIDGQILAPLRRALAARELAFKGVLYIGLMLESKSDIPKAPDGESTGSAFQPYVLEFNARFGDPETQAVLPLMTSDLVPVLWQTTESKLDSVPVLWSKQSASCVVACADTYPEKGSQGQAIKISRLPHESLLFHAGTKKADNGSIVTAGGRVFCVTGLGPSMEAAVEKAYEGLSQVSFNGMAYRKDIGRRAAVAKL